MKNQFTRLLLALCGALISATTLAAQNAAPLRGQVVDELGAVVSGARATLITRGGKKRSAISNANGEFTIPNIAPGVYTLTVEFKGFQARVEPGLLLPAAAPLKVVLMVAPVNAETEVKDLNNGVSVEPDQNLNAIVLDEKMIGELLPDNEDDLLDFLQALAGGQGKAQIIIDGFGGGHTPPREAIMQIRINLNPFSAEFSGGGGGRIEIITRPGADQWNGSLGFGFRNSALDARNAFAKTKPALDQKRNTFTLGGPLIPKRLDFFLSAEYTPTAGDGFAVATTLNGPYTANVPASYENRSLFFRSGLLINKWNTLNLGYNLRGSDYANLEFVQRFGGGFGGSFGAVGGGGGANFMLPERASNSESGDHALTFAETFLINARMILESRLRLQRNRSVSAGATPNAPAIDVLDAFYGGGSPCCPNDARQDNVEYQEYLTVTTKRHALRGGLQLEYETRRNLNGGNFNGTYTFSTLEQYRLGAPTQFTINRGDPSLRYSQYEAAWFAQDDLRVNRDFTLSLGARHEFQSHLGDKLNFAPRIGLAWKPARGGKTVIRGGGGLFFNHLSAGVYANTLRYDGLRQESIVIANPAYPFELLKPSLDNLQASPQRTSIQALDPRLTMPYIFNAQVSVERQLRKAAAATITYNFSRGLHLFRTRNINAPYPCEPNSDDPFCGDGMRRPAPARGNLLETESAGRSIHHGVAFGFQRRAGRLSFFGAYTLAWTRDDVSFPADNYNLKPEWSRSSSDRRHSFNLYLMMDLPRGLKLTPSLSASSGAPFNISTGLDDNRDTQFNDRPPGVARNADLPASLYSLVPRLDRLVSAPGGPALSLGDYLATYFPHSVRAQGPGFSSLNLSLSKTFGFGRRNGQQSSGARAEASRFALQLSANVSNLLNHVNYYQFSGVLGSPYFGHPSNAYPARQFNLSLQFRFSGLGNAAKSGKR